jgi:dipeptidase E
MSKVLLVSTIKGHLVPKFVEIAFNKPNNKIIYIPPQGDHPKNELYLNFWQVLADSHDCHLYFLDNTTKITDEEVELFSEADVLIAPGGNTFTFLHNIKFNGYFRYMQEFINSKDKSYIGMSAGAILTSPNIEIARDDNEVDLNNFNSLNHIKRTVIVHFDPINDIRDPNKYKDPIIITDDGYALFNNKKLIEYKF